MLPVWHTIVAAFHWLHAHLASVGISAVVTGIGGGIMWALGFRKARLGNQKLALEIDHLRIDTQRIDLEVQRLREEKIQREAAKSTADLSERIIELAKMRIKRSPNTGGAPFSEEQLCTELAASKEAIKQAVCTLEAQGHASYKNQFEIWIIKP
jgi:hypothetical protein